MAINPLDVISRGAKLNPAVTKILIAVPVLLACVALGIKLVSDPQTAIIGGILTIFAAVVLLVVTSLGRDAMGGASIWFARFCLLFFCVTSLTLFSSWTADWPKPMGCLVQPTAPCRTDFVSRDSTGTVKKTPNDTSADVLRSYMFPDEKSGRMDETRLKILNRCSTELGIDMDIRRFLLMANRAAERALVIQCARGKGEKI